MVCYKAISTMDEYETVNMDTDSEHPSDFELITTDGSDCEQGNATSYLTEVRQHC